jgi:hypothetical protein
MSFPKTEIDKISLELSELARAYADKAEALANDPYFREAVIRSSVSSFAWALYHRFEGGLDRAALNREMQVQSAAISDALGEEGSIR